MPTPFFADLVRELCQEGGTGPLTPVGAVPGHRRFADAVPAGVAFHYAVAGIAQPGQWEVGTGRIDGNGRLVREAIVASSAGGTRVDFAPGLKTIALTVGANWFAVRDAAEAAIHDEIDALNSALAAKQPLSTTHPPAAAAAASDLLTVRRAGGWVNIPLTALAFRDGVGRYVLEGGIDVADGSPGAPALRFAADGDTGLFRPANDVLAFAAGGAECLRLTAAGRCGLGTDTPAHLLDLAASPGVAGEVQTPMRLRSKSNVASNAVEMLFAPLTSGQTRTALGARREGAGVHAAFYIATGGAERVNIDSAGNITPGGDNAQSFGWSSARWAVVYAATGTIHTSDAREKAWRGVASAAELQAARRIAGELGFYQWNDAIAVKGTDGARYHFGARAQRVWAIMAEEGLVAPIDAGGRPGATPYAFLCWDAWDEGDDARDRFGIRPDQLTLFLIAAQEARIAALEAGA